MQMGRWVGRHVCMYANMAACMHACMYGRSVGRRQSGDVRWVGGSVGGRDSYVARQEAGRGRGRLIGM